MVGHCPMTCTLHTEVSLDTARTWCPSSGCRTICNIWQGSKYQGVDVTCPTCDNQFCSSCSATWHEGLSCEEQVGDEAGLWGDLEENIKKCPQCQVPIERNEGCAQMMCRRCKHVFCWFCLASLDVSSKSSLHDNNLNF
jgi:E3 ubiquitin-protein ligase RNF144